MPQTDFRTLLDSAQKYISQHYSAVLSEKSKSPQLKPYLEKYLRDTGYTIPNMSSVETVDLLYREMAEYSVLTPMLDAEATMVEEANVNSWDDVTVTFTDGRKRKLKQPFYSPQHAVDIVKRLLSHSGIVIDNASPIAQGHLPNNMRITAMIAPIVDPEVGVAASIRRLNTQQISRDTIIGSGFSTEEMYDFLCMCIRYRQSFVIAGATSSGKTTLLNCILASIPDSKRIFTIENGSRELSLVKRINGKVANNVVHTLSRPSDNPNYDVTQEDLVIASLRFNPDLVCVGEMRDTEAYSTVESAHTGYTVVSTVHAVTPQAAHERIAMLCLKRNPIKFELQLRQVMEAFPIVVYTSQLEDNSRKIMSITECELLPDGGYEYRPLYRYDIKGNTLNGDKYVIDGEFTQPGQMSEAMRNRLIIGGAPQSELAKYTKGGSA